MVPGRDNAGALHLPNTVAQWIFGSGIGVRLNSESRFGVKNYSGEIRYLADYNGGSSVPFSQQTAAFSSAGSNPLRLVPERP
jgi:hypothetical protein